MDNDALIDHGSGIARSVSEILLVGRISHGPSSLSSANSSPPPELAAASVTFAVANGAKASPATAGQVGTTRISASPRPRPPVRPGTTAPISTEDVSKIDLAIMACSISLLVPVALHIRDFTSSWETPWKVLYGVLMIVSLVSTVTGFFTAWCPAVSWGRRLSPTCARLGLLDAAVLFIVFLACKLGRFGCAAGVASAAVVLVVLAGVWVWSERQATGRAEAAAAVQLGAGLPHDAP